MLKLLLLTLLTIAVAPFADAAAGQRAYKSYDYAETAEGVLKEVRLTIPAGLPVVRGT